ncbi:MAG: yfeR [Deltaproteobacteria bacterium]|nr:yfeR [Deltaproteobacteria bacterium]
MLTLRQLEVFGAAAKRLNLTEAGRTLSVTQTAVSHAIKELENLLEVKLIKKMRTGIELTQAGEAFRTDVEKMLYQRDDLLRIHSRKKI